ncbi:MAG: ribosome maturation factor RimP [Ruminococcaceae bacterium]|nr:ribosome maturation factor RimP [Oscillospiraceae bacterium]
MVLAGVADRVFTLIKDTVETQNVRLWDVKFVKEGASYYLRVFIDSDEGINIDDCTNVSHAIDPIIDEADPIDKSYYLEVCSPGLERELSREEHFAKFIGSEVKVKLYRALDGKKEVIGELLGFDGGIQLKIGDDEIYFEKKDYSSVRLNDLD